MTVLTKTLSLHNCIPDRVCLARKNTIFFVNKQTHAKRCNQRITQRTGERGGEGGVISPIFLGPKPDSSYRT